MSQEPMRYVSPDGLLTFVVVAGEAGDTALGFDGFPWHTHGSILAATSGLPHDAAIAEFVDALLGNRAVIATMTIDGRPADVWIADDPLKADPYASDGEVITFRLWDGTPWKPPVC